MIGNFGASGQGVDATAVESDLPDWTYSDMLSGLEQFIGTLPNLAADSGDSGASECVHQSGTEAKLAGPSTQQEKEKRRQHKNKVRMTHGTASVYTRYCQVNCL